MSTKNSKPIVLTLDAGGTNFVFSAYQDFKEIIAPIRRSANPHDQDGCVHAIISGFELVRQEVTRVDAISFAFPGPADYANGVLGDLPNFKAFNGVFPLGPILKNHFKVPVFINNDGNLFAMGEAMAGFLPHLNDQLQKFGSPKRFENLIGLTLGTGFGGGIVMNGSMLKGDNSCGAEVHNMINPLNSIWNAEEDVSTRAIQRIYSEKSGPGTQYLMPKDIYEIATGQQEGSVSAAKHAFEVFGRSLGLSIRNLLTVIDGIVVVGGGISAAWDQFSPSMFTEINRPFKNACGEETTALSFDVFDLENTSEFEAFAKGKLEELVLPGQPETIKFDNMPRVGVARTQIGTSRAIAIGAYGYAVKRLIK